METSFNHVAIITFASKDGKELKVHDSVSDICSSIMSGMGTVNLVAFKVKYNFTAADQYIRFGFTSSLAARSMDEVAASANSHQAWSNQYTYGPQHVYDVVIPSTFSRQIQPVSSARVMPQFEMVASAAVRVSLEIHLQVIQPMIHYFQLTL